MRQYIVGIDLGTTHTVVAYARLKSIKGKPAATPGIELLAIDQTVRIAAPGVAGSLREVRAKIRWRRDNHYGVVFDDTFTLGDFARLAARLQAPALLEA